MIKLTCPYCGFDAEETAGANNQWEAGLQIVPINRIHKLVGYKIGIAFECKECDREFFVNEDVFLRYNAEESERMPTGFKHHEYCIRAGWNQAALQDMAFAFDYEWSNGKKCVVVSVEEVGKEFEYLCMEPEIKRLSYAVNKPGNSEEIDLHGYIQLLNGNEPDKKPDDLQGYIDNMFDPEDVIPLIEEYGIHGIHSRYDRRMWMNEVTERNTQLGYWEWVLHSIEADDG